MPVLKENNSLADKQIAELYDTVYYNNNFGYH